MPESAELFRYISYVRLRWRWIAISCAVALGIALAVGLATPRQYTATARIVIEPPAGSDLRSAMAVSPIYLESLKTYEHFAASDSLFQKAVEKFDLRTAMGSRPLESLKRRALKVGLVRNTRILEISATLPEPRKAQALAQFVAESTVDLARAMVNEGNSDLIRGIEQQQREVRARLVETEDAWSKLLAAEPVGQLKSAIENAAHLRATIQRQIASVEQDLANGTQQGGDHTESHARLAQMRKQIEGLDRQSAQQEKLMAERSARRDRVEAERKARQGELLAIETRLREARGDAAYRGERLRIIDPGVVPERPSTPNVPLNLAAALLMGTVLPAVYLALEMNWRAQRVTARVAAFHE